jgi:hypothetical protein
VYGVYGRRRSAPYHYVDTPLPEEQCTDAVYSRIHVYGTLRRIAGFGLGAILRKHAAPAALGIVRRIS